MIWFAVLFLSFSVAEAQTLCDWSREEIARAQPALEQALISAGKLLQLEQSGAFRAPSDRYYAVDTVAVSIFETFAQSPQITLEEGIAAVTAIEGHLRCAPPSEAVRKYLELIAARMRERLDDLASAEVKELQRKMAGPSVDLRAVQNQAICSSLNLEIKTVEARLELAKFARKTLASDEKWRSTLIKLREEICATNPLPASNAPTRP